VYFVSALLLHVGVLLYKFCHFVELATSLKQLSQMCSPSYICGMVRQNDFKRSNDFKRLRGAEVSEVSDHTDSRFKVVQRTWV